MNNSKNQNKEEFFTKTSLFFTKLILKQLNFAKIKTQAIIPEKFNEFLKIKEKWLANCKLFNQSPKKFLKGFLNEFSDLSEEEKANNIAIFLRISQNIESSKLIEVLGGSGDFNKLIMKKYFDTFDFKNINVVDALRILFSNFLMFGESQVIERVIGGFSSAYYHASQVL